MPHLRSDVADLHHRLEANVLLDSQREVIDRRSLRMGFNDIDRTWSHRIDRQGRQVAHRARGSARNSQPSLERGIADQVTASSAATGTVGVINASHAPQDRLARPSQIPRKANARLPIDGLLLSEAFWHRRISSLNDSVQLIACARNEGTDQVLVQELSWVAWINRKLAGR